MMKMINKNNKKGQWIGFILMLILFVALQAMISGGIVSRFQRSILILICINIILATSLNVTVGCLGQITLGHAGFMSIGAYTAAIFTKSGLVSAPFSYFIGIVLAAVAAGGVGVLIGIPALRLRGDYLAILTLAFGEIIRVFIETMNITGGAQGLVGIPLFQNFAIIYWITVLSVVIMYLELTSRHGRAILSIREDEIASEASGINTTYYKTLAFAISAAFAGVAGAIYAHNLGVLGAKQFDYNYSISILVIVVLGGLGSFTGAILSAIVLSILPELLRGFNDYRMILFALILIGMMLFRPMGLLGRSEFEIHRVIECFQKKKYQKEE